MSNSSFTQPSPRVLFLGMQGTFSLSSLQAILGAGVAVCAVIIPMSSIPGRDLPALRQLMPPGIRRPALPLLTTSSVQLAHRAGIPVWEVSRLSSPEVVAALSEYTLDIICVACFSQRIPRAILDIPRLGSLNVHPSLLPANRGPEPLFWTFRKGCQQTGVTIHMVTEGMDSGDILAQEPIDVPDGMDYAQLEARCAVLGGQLLARSVWNLYKGVAVSTPQDESKSSYHPFPSAEDFEVDVSQWDARHLYNFICGVGSHFQSVKLSFADRSVFVRQALAYGYTHDGYEDTQDRQDRAVICVQCKTGWVNVVVESFI